MANFYKDNQNLFAQRVKDKKITDCHGDLHMEHICLSDPIIIFDCIEFNERFRYIDTASDISFLLMDLEFNGGKKLAEQLCKNYLTLMGEQDDTLINHLIEFYKTYRAYVRGKVTSFILKDPAVPKPVQGKRARALGYHSERVGSVDRRLRLCENKFPRKQNRSRIQPGKEIKRYVQ